MADNPYYTKVTLETNDRRLIERITRLFKEYPQHDYLLTIEQRPRKSSETPILLTEELGDNID
jgi:hypothetical protein